MNPNTDDHVPPFNDAACEREWLAQERALQRERMQLDPAGDDALSQRYRMLARALREPLGETLPVDFAQRVTARADAMPMRPIALESRFEFVLIPTLGLTLVGAASVVMTIYASAWLPVFHAIVPALQAPVNGWLLALAGCVGASWLLGQWPPRKSS